MFAALTAQGHVVVVYTKYTENTIYDKTYIIPILEHFLNLHMNCVIWSCINM